MSIISTILSPITDIAKKFIADKDKVNEFKHEVEMSLVNLDLAQMDVNKEEAKNPSIFVSGWRPAVGWVCVIALAFNYIISPLGNWAAAIWMPEVTLPSLDIQELMTLLFGLLGMGTLRSYDKKQGTARHKI